MEYYVIDSRLPSSYFILPWKTKLFRILFIFSRIESILLGDIEVDSQVNDFKLGTEVIGLTLMTQFWYLYIIL